MRLFLSKQASHSSTNKNQPAILHLLIALNTTNPKEQEETETMAAVTSAAVSIPSFTGLKAASGSATSKFGASVKMSASSVPKLSVKASMKEIGVAVVVTAASALLASNAMAKEILLGSDDGGLVFVPSNFNVASGETIVFRNNAAFPHNVIFDEDAVPAGVNAPDISMGEDELLNAKDQVYEVTLTVKGDYGFYCSPHQGAGMVGNLTVN